jgi:hypothetical protein
MSDWNGGQNKQDEDQLNLLSTFFYIFAAFNLLGICVGGFYIFGASAIVASAGRGSTGDLPPAGLFVGMGLFICLVSMAVAALNFFAAKSLKGRRNLTFVMIASGINCLNFPFGTALGIFTFIVTSRPSVKALFTS